MTITTVDAYLNMISSTKDRSTLSKIKGMIDNARDNHTLTPVMFQGLNKDIRDRADWLRTRRVK